MGKITYTKTDRIISSVPLENKVTAADMMEIKTSVNALYDLMENLRQLITVLIVANDFSGSNYQNGNLVGLTPDVDFQIFQDFGSGILLKVNESYLFNATTGTITAEKGSYRLNIYKRIV